MDTLTKTLICPNCKKSIPVDQALGAEFSEKVKKDFEEKREREREEERKEMLTWKEEQKKKISEENDLELKTLKEEAERKDQELKKSREAELILLNKEKMLKEKLESADLEVARRVNEEADKIREETAKKIQEESRLRDAEKDKKISDMLKQVEELKVKAQQGSQQLQGEVLELELEEILKKEFLLDDILPISKGVRGADVIQIIKDKTGRQVGKIIWESKRTKAFVGDWIEKLKEDMREAKADIAVLVPSVLPIEINLFGFKDGVYITNFDVFLQVAHLLRKSLLEISSTKALSVGKNEKIEALYQYITSSEFAQKIDSMLETYSGMLITLEKEKMLIQKVWAQREKEIERLKTNTLTIHGSLSGLIEEPLQKVKSLEFEEMEIIVEESVDDGNQ